jgi:hypothetical protein
MAGSKAIMARLTRVERGSAETKRMLGQIANILSDQNDRIDRVGDRVDQLGERVDQLSERVDRLGERLEGRLDRLIAVTIQERTYSVERLADIERRLSRLEERSGL